MACATMTFDGACSVFKPNDLVNMHSSFALVTSRSDKLARFTSGGVTPYDTSSLVLDVPLGKGSIS